MLLNQLPFLQHGICTAHRQHNPSNAKGWANRAVLPDIGAGTYRLVLHRGSPLSVAGLRRFPVTMAMTAWVQFLPFPAHETCLAYLPAPLQCSHSRCFALARHESTICDLPSKSPRIRAIRARASASADYGRHTASVPIHRAVTRPPTGPPPRQAPPRPDPAARGIPEHVSSASATSPRSSRRCRAPVSPRKSPCPAHGGSARGEECCTALAIHCACNTVRCP